MNYAAEQLETVTDKNYAINSWVFQAVLFSFVLSLLLWEQDLPCILWSYVIMFVSSTLVCSGVWLSQQIVFGSKKET